MNDPKYRAIWIPSGDDYIEGTICVDDFGNPYKLFFRKGMIAFQDDCSVYVGEHHRQNFRPAKLYLCDRNKHAGGRIYNPVTQEWFICPNEYYITRTNDYSDDWNVVAPIDPKTILRGFTPIEEENIEGFMFGGGDDQLGYVVVKGIDEEFYVKLP
jgi:hypothetical protein